MKLLKSRTGTRANLSVTLVILKQEEGGRYFVIPFLSPQQLAYVIGITFFTHECDMFGVSVTVYRMWLKMLILVLTFLSRSVFLEFALWLMALTAFGGIWLRIPARF